MRVNEFAFTNKGISLSSTQKIIPIKPNPIHAAIGQHFREILDEDSTVTSAVRNSPYVDQLVKVIHKELALPHDQKWQQVPTISWADIKDYSGNFVIITGTKGTAAVKWNNGHYAVVTSGPDGIEVHDRVSSINSISTDIKSAIGKMNGFWVNPDKYYPARNNGESPDWHTKSTSNSKTSVDNKRKSRADSRQINSTLIYDPNASNGQNIEILTRKLLPLYKKYVDHALADVRGAIGIAIKNDALDRAGKKINIAKNLQKLSDWFARYSKDGPLISIIDVSNMNDQKGKWQIHSSTNQFVDAHQTNRYNSAENAEEFGRLFPGLMFKIVESLELHSEELKNASAELGISNFGWNIVEEISRLRNKFPGAFTEVQQNTAV